MFKNKPVLIVLMLALWGASVVVMFKSTAPSVPVAHAEGLNVKATLKSADTIEVKYDAVPQVTSYKIERLASGGSGNKEDSVIATASNPTTYIDAGLANGDYTYKVSALKNTEVLKTSTSNSVVVSGSPATGVTPPPGGTDPPPKSEFLGKECSDADAAAKVAAKSTSNKVFKNTIYETIDSKGVKQVYKWTLSLVNLLVLFFLLIIAFSNILRLNIDTYAVQKVFTPLILGVLLANFGWLICRFFLEISTILYHALTDSYGGGAGLFAKIAQEGYGFGNICSIAKGNTIGLGSSLLGSFVGTAMMLVAGVLFLTLYALLVARVWIITLLMVISPLAFLALGFPMTSQYFKKWWSLFFNWVFMAPASFLILVLALKMADIGDGPNLTKYIIITGLLYFAVQVPFKMGGEWMTKWGGYVSQFKKGAAAPAQALGRSAQKRIGESYAGYRDEALNRAKYALWKNPLGKKVSEMQANTAWRRKTVEDDLNAARRRGTESYLQSAHGTRAQIKASRATLRNKTIDDTVKLSAQEGEIGFLHGGSAEATRIRQRQAELTAQTELATKEIEQIKGKDRYKYLHETDRGRAIDKRLGELRLEGATLTEELHHLESESDKTAKGSDPGQKLLARMRQLAKEHELVEHEISIIEAKAQGEWDKSDEGIALRRKISAHAQLAKTAKEKLAGFEIGVENIWRNEDMAEEAKRIKLQHRVHVLRDLVNKENENKAAIDAKNLKDGTDVKYDTSRRDKLQAKLTRKETALEASPGSLAVEATMWEKERQIAEKRLEKHDEQTSPEASKRTYWDDSATSRALMIQKRLERKYAIADKLVGEHEASLGDVYKDIQTQLEEEHNRIYAEVENRLKGAGEDPTPSQVEKATRKQIDEDALDDTTAIGKLLAEQKDLSGDKGAALIDQRAKIHKALNQAEQTTLEKKRISSNRAPEVALELISSQDSVKEDLTEILARASEPTGDAAADSKRIMAIVNAKRAMWRNYIKRNEQIIERFGQLAFADMISMNQKQTAERVGTTLLGNKMTARDVKNLATDYSFRNFQAGAAKELVDGETKKSQVRVAIEMKTPQEYRDSIRTVTNSINHLEETLKQREALFEARVKRQSEEFESELRSKNKTMKPDEVKAKTVEHEAKLRKHEDNIREASKREIILEQKHLKQQHEELTTYVQKKSKEAGDNWNELEEFLKPYFKKDEHGKIGNDWTAVYDANEMPGGRKVNFDRVIAVVGPDAKARASMYGEQKSVFQRGQDIRGEGDDVYDPQVWTYMLTRQAQKQQQVMIESPKYNKKRDAQYKPDPRDGHKPASELASLIKDGQSYRTADGLLARQKLLEPMPYDLMDLMLSKIVKGPGYDKLSSTYKATVDNLFDRMRGVEIDSPEYNDIMQDARERLVANDPQDAIAMMAAFKETIHWMDEGRVAMG